MDKNSLKSFAIEARKELREKVGRRLKLLGISEAGKMDLTIKIMGREVEIAGNLYPKNSYENLMKRYAEIGFEQLVEESAYTWFNRLTAFAYMEANNYIEERMIFNTGVKIEPEIMDNYFNADFFQSMDVEKQNELHNLKDRNTPEAIDKMYSILLEEKCYELSKIMPFMFGKRGEYSDILFPSGLLTPNSLLIKLREEFNKAKEKNEETGEELVPVEIIGWLYQYYNSELKDEVFLDLKQNKKITKEKIAPATQLFTPHWIVKYMAENSLGKLAVESCGAKDKVKKNWKYFIDSENSSTAERIKIEDVKIIDPAMGSGHMLTYCFDMLSDIYDDLGWSKKDAVLSILKNNLYGLEIDKRAGQLASFAIFMKGREKFSRLFKVVERLEEDEKLILNTLWIEKSNKISQVTKNLISVNSLENLQQLLINFVDADEYGSILKVEELDISQLYSELEKLKEVHGEQGQLSLSYENISTQDFFKDCQWIEKLIQQQQIMTNKYDITITNPPYMGGRGFTEKLKKYVEKNYKDSKSDMFAVFIERCRELTRENRYTAMITMQSWMFLSSFENLRKTIIKKTEIQSLIHLGYGVIGIAFGTTAFVLKSIESGKKGKYFRLFDEIAQNIETNDCAGLFRNAVEEKEFRYNFKEYSKNKEVNKNIEVNEIGNKIQYQIDQKEFEKIPGSPIAYWVSDKIRNIFEKSQKLGDVGEAKQGLATADNDRFLRFWSEINYQKIGFGMSSGQEALESGKKWFPYNKGGEKRKWYGNQEYLVNWENDGYEIKNFKNAVIRNPKYYFRESISWTDITSSGNSFRVYPRGFIYDVTGMSYFKNDDISLLGVLNNKFIAGITKILNPTLHLQIGDVVKLPYLCLKNINNIVQQNIDISKEEWDSRETSWDFEKLYIAQGNSIKTAYENYCHHWREKFVQMHKNEEELNKIFIEIYDLKDEMDESVSFEDITLLKKEAKVVSEILTPPQPIEKVEAQEKTPEGYLINRGTLLEFNKLEIVKQFLSYAVGCIMGRYSIDKVGLVMANSDDILVASSEKIIIKNRENEIRHTIENPRFFPEEFGILPVTSEKIFENDIVTRVIEFIKALYGEENFEENINFICEALGKKEEETYDTVLRNYFIKDFYADHLQRYQKRPIYWMENSGKKNGFSALIYLHRYEATTIARIRTEYLLPYQEKMENLKSYYERTLDNENINNKDKKTTEKKLKELEAILKELKEHANSVKHIAEQKIAIDLDDGVKVNYEKFGNILKKI